VRQGGGGWNVLLRVDKASRLGRVRDRAALNLRRVYAINQVECCRNFIFKRNFPIHKTFERSCEIGLWRMTSSKISEVFGTRLPKS
jgi:hypothetical protein